MSTLKVGDAIRGRILALRAKWQLRAEFQRQPLFDALYLDESLSTKIFSECQRFRCINTFGYEALLLRIGIT